MPRTLTSDLCHLQSNLPSHLPHSLLIDSYSWGHTVPSLRTILTLHLCFCVTSLDLFLCIPQMGEISLIVLLPLTYSLSMIPSSSIQVAIDGIALFLVAA